jgi:hypothetical protein
MVEVTGTAKPAALIWDAGDISGIAADIAQAPQRKAANSNQICR